MSTEQTIKRNVQKLQRVIVDALEGVKGQDIQVFNTEALSPLFERVMVASGTSNRQTRALAMAVRDAVKDAGFSKPRIEGEDNGEWIIVDCGIAVVHVMQPVIRQYYRLEELWGEVPVRLGRAGPKTGQTHSETFAREVVAAGAVPGKKAKAGVAKTVAAPASTPASRAAKTKSTVKAAAAKSTKAVKLAAGARDAVKATVKAQPKNKSEAAKPSTKAATKPVKPVARKTAGPATAASKTTTAKRVVTKAVPKATVKTVVVTKGGNPRKAVASKAPVKAISKPTATARKSTRSKA